MSLLYDDLSWLSVRGPDGEILPNRRHIDYSITDPEKLLVLLRKGQFIGQYDSVKRCDFFGKPGMYTVKWNYRDYRGFLSDDVCWRGKLVSNEIQIEIVK